jgi:hypothetical protein
MTEVKVKVASKQIRARIYPRIQAFFKKLINFGSLSDNIFRLTDIGSKIKFIFIVQWKVQLQNICKGGMQECTCF